MTQAALQTRSTYDDYMRRWNDLDNEYVSSQTQARQMEVIRYVQPDRGRFFLDEQNKQPRKDLSIINDTASDASDKLKSALAVGISSAARKWVSFTSSVPEIRDDHECKDYFDEFRDVVLQLCAESNFYKVLDEVYADLVCPATSLMWIEEDERDVIRAVHRPVGQYRLALDARARVSTVYERVSMTVEQVVEAFCLRPGRGQPDLSKLSRAVQNAYERQRYDDWVTMLHVVEPRTVRQYGRIDARNKPWASCWMEWSATRSSTGVRISQDGGPLEIVSESGFDEQAFIAPRWAATGEDVYGSRSPAMRTIGDIRALQVEEVGSGKLLAKILDPPLNIPPTLTSGSLVPGHHNHQEDPRVKVEPTYVPDWQAIPAIAGEKREFERRVTRGHYGDLLFLISADPRTQPGTAEEIRAKKEERLLGVGGMFGRFSDEGLTPALNRIGSIAQRRGHIRPPPRKLLESARRGGRIVKAEFLNSIAEAMKAQGVQPILGWVNDTMAMAKETARPDILDNVNFDGVVETTADMRGVPAKLVVAPEVRDQKRQQRADAQAQQQAVEAAPQIAGAAKDLSSVDPDNLRQITRQFGPAAEAEAAGNGL